MSARVARVANMSENSNLKMSRSKQMLQILPIALAQVEAGNKSENLLIMQSDKTQILCIEQKKLLKKDTTI